MSRAPSPSGLTPDQRELVGQLEALGVDQEVITQLIASSDPVASDAPSALGEPEPTWAELARTLLRALAWHARKLFMKE